MTELTINDLSLTEIIRGTSLTIVEHIECLREGKEIKLDNEGVWCDCESK